MNLISKIKILWKQIYCEHKYVLIKTEKEKCQSVANDIYLEEETHECPLCGKIKTIFNFLNEENE